MLFKGKNKHLDLIHHWNVGGGGAEKYHTDRTFCLWDDSGYKSENKNAFVFPHLQSVLTLAPHSPQIYEFLLQDMFKDLTDSDSDNVADDDLQCNIDRVVL